MTVSRLNGTNGTRPKPTLAQRHNEAVAYRHAVELLKVHGAEKHIPDSWPAVQRNLYRLAAEAEEAAAYLADDRNRAELLLSAAGFWFASEEFTKAQSAVRNAMRRTVSPDLAEKLLEISAAAETAKHQAKARERLIDESGQV